jgi:hypothetical protein
MALAFKRREHCIEAFRCLVMQAVYSMMSAAQGFSSEERSEFVPGSVFGAPPEPFAPSGSGDGDGATERATANAEATAAADIESRPEDLSEWTVRSPPVSARRQSRHAR